LTRKNKNPPTPRRRNQVFQSLFSMFGTYFYSFGKFGQILEALRTYFRGQNNSTLNRLTRLGF
jgi:hypothetical protein